MNGLISIKISDSQFFNIEGNRLTIGSCKKIGIASITDYLAKNIFTEFKQTKLKNDQYNILQHNLKFIKAKIDKHNNAWPVKCAYWLGLNILINQLGLDKYSFFANLKTCDTEVIDSLIDKQVIKNLEDEGFDQKIITKILDFIRSPHEHDSLSFACNNLLKIPTIIFIHPAFYRLKELYLSENQLTALPTESRN